MLYFLFSDITKILITGDGKYFTLVTAYTLWLSGFQLIEKLLTKCFPIRWSFNYFRFIVFELLSILIDQFSISVIKLFGAGNLDVSQKWKSQRLSLKLVKFQKRVFLILDEPVQSRLKFGGIF